MEIDPRRIEVMDDRVAEIMRRKTLGEKLAMLDASWRFAHSLVEASVKRLKPGLTDQELHREIIRRMSRGAI